MICPKCNAEYRFGITECIDCQISLVDSISKENESQDHDAVDYRLVISTSNLGDIAVIKSLLDAERIPYFVEGENFNLVTPWIEPVKFFVREDSVDQALDALRSFNVRPIGPSTSVAEDGESD